MIIVKSISQGQRIDNEIIYPRDRFALQLKYPRKEYANRYADQFCNGIEVKIKNFTITQ